MGTWGRRHVGLNDTSARGMMNLRLSQLPTRKSDYLHNYTKANWVSIMPIEKVFNLLTDFCESCTFLLGHAGQKDAQTQQKHEIRETLWEQIGWSKFTYKGVKDGEMSLAHDICYGKGGLGCENWPSSYRLTKMGEISFKEVSFSRGTLI